MKKKIENLILDKEDFTYPGNIVVTGSCCFVRNSKLNISGKLIFENPETYIYFSNSEINIGSFSASYSTTLVAFNSNIQIIKNMRCGEIFSNNGISVNGNIKCNIISCRVLFVGENFSCSKATVQTDIFVSGTIDENKWLDYTAKSIYSSNLSIALSTPFHFQGSISKFSVHPI